MARNRTERIDRMTTRRYPSTSPDTSGDDTRIRRTDIDHEWRDSFAAYPEMVSAGGSDMSALLRDVEVQAYRPTLPGMATADYVVISLGLAGPTGEAMVMLSKAEATDIALALLQAVNDAGRLEVAAYLEAHRPEAVES
jgi:hypothetical protein